MSKCWSITIAVNRFTSLAQISHASGLNPSIYADFQAQALTGAFINPIECTTPHHLPYQSRPLYETKVLRFWIRNWKSHARLSLIPVVEFSPSTNYYGIPKSRFSYHSLTITSSLRCIRVQYVSVVIYYNACQDSGTLATKI